jgi:hypothetical protein
MVRVSVLARDRSLTGAGAKMSSSEVHAVVSLVRAGFTEMSGLRLTLPQASRWGLEPPACRDVIDVLI